MSVLIKGMEMPDNCINCPMLGLLFNCRVIGNGEMEDNITVRRVDCPLIEIPPHGRLIDADALIADLKRQCKEVFRIDAVSPDDFWITRNEAYNERLWTTWCESLYDYINAAPTIIEAEGRE